MKKRGVFAIILAAAMIFTVMAFASCAPKDGDEDAGEIVIFMRITSLSGEILWDDDVEITVPSNFTVVEATRFVCGLEGIRFETEAIAGSDYVKQIGSDRSTDIFADSEPETEPETEPVGVVSSDDGDEDAPPPPPPPTEPPPPEIYDWVVYSGGKEVSQRDIVQIAQTIEWRFELIDQDKK